RKWDQEVLGVELAAGAEAAANIALDQIDRGRRQPEHRRHCIAIKERYLRGAENDQSLARGIPFGKQSARFHRQCGIALNLEMLAPDIGSLAKRRVGVALCAGKDHRDIRAALLK